jgi:hypothetical protein
VRTAHHLRISTYQWHRKWARCAPYLTLPITERRSNVRIARGERGIWQRRFWEHVIRDDDDYAAHIDYCHINPLKHGLVSRVADWPYSTFHRYVEQGLYPLDWAASPSIGFVDASVVECSSSGIHAAQYATLLTPYGLHLTAFHLLSFAFNLF